jgi:transposase
MDTPPPLPPEMWEHTPPGAQELMVAQAAALAQLRAEVAQLKVTVEALAQRVGRNSHHASQPPSADPPHARRRSRREPSGRRPGGQPGHEGQTRTLSPVEAVDVVIPVKPGRCPRGQHPLPGEDAQPQRHQVTESPPVRPVVTEDQWHQWGGPVCGAVTRADRPAGVSTGGFGPRVQAITALCTGAYHRSKRTTQPVMADRLGLPLRVGTMANLEHATVQALAEPVTDARSDVQQPPAASLDDTGGREGQQRAWLWTAVTAWVTVFVVRRRRSGEGAQELLGERFGGWLVTDRWSASTWYPGWRRQLCGAHVLRDIDAMSERGGRSQEIGEALRVQARQLFHWWHRVRDGTLSHASLASSRRPVRREVERRLDTGHTCGGPKTAGVCRELRKVRQARWTFVRHVEVEPTNTVAERAIRPGVLWRKGSFGTHSPAGSRFVDTMMTVVATLKPQHRHVLDYLTAACEAALHGEHAPSLLPTPDQLNACLPLAA